MPWPWNRAERVPEDGHLGIVVTIQWGLARIAVSSVEDAPRLWVHGMAVGATASRRDGTGDILDDHVAPIGAPIRLSPGGRFDDAWRPSAFALDDGTLHRPTFHSLVSVSVHRRQPVTLRPRVEVVDDFTWTDGRYELIEGSALWAEAQEPPDRTW